MAVTLLRHTTPDVAKGVCYGRTDLPLAESFLQEAQQAAQELKRPSVILSSPLTRCHQLARHVAAEFQMEVTPIEHWIEMDFGLWEGVPWSGIPRAQIDAWADDFMDYAGHQGESVRALETRITAALKAAPKDALIVTHAGCIKAALAITGDAAGWQARPQFGEAVQIAV